MVYSPDLLNAVDGCSQLAKRAVQWLRHPRFVEAYPLTQYQPDLRLGSSQALQSYRLHK